MGQRFIDSTLHWSTNPTKYSSFVGSNGGPYTSTGHGRAGGRAITWTASGWGLKQSQAALLIPFAANSTTIGAYVYCSTSGTLEAMRCGDVYLMITATGHMELWYKYFDPVNKQLLDATSAVAIPPGSAHFLEWQIGHFPLTTSPTASVVMIDEVQTSIGTIRPLYVHGDVYLGPEGHTVGDPASFTLAMSDIYIVDNQGGYAPYNTFQGNIHTACLLPVSDAEIDGGWHTTGGTFADAINNAVDPGPSFIYGHNASFAIEQAAFFLSTIPLTEGDPIYLQPFIATTPEQNTAGTIAPPSWLDGYLSDDGAGHVGGGSLETSPSFTLPASNSYPWQYFWTVDYANVGGGIKDLYNGVGVATGFPPYRYYGVCGASILPNSGTVWADVEVAHAGLEMYWAGNPGPYVLHLPSVGRSRAFILGA